MTDVFSTIGIVPYNKKKFERAQEYSRWNRFSGIPKPGSGNKEKKGVGHAALDSEKYYDEDEAERTNDLRAKHLSNDYITGHEKESESSE